MAKDIKADQKRPSPDDPGWKEIEGEFDEAWLTPEGWEDSENDADGGEES